MTTFAHSLRSESHFSLSFPQPLSHARNATRSESMSKCGAQLEGGVLKHLLSIDALKRAVACGGGPH